MKPCVPGDAPQTHEGFIDRNPDQPRIKFRLALKLPQVLERLQERILDDVLRILLILCNVLSDAKYVTVVTPHQLLECTNVPVSGRIDQYGFVANRTTYFRFDGFHSYFLFRSKNFQINSQR